MQRLLDAARDLVESEPIEAVTTTRIARRADLPVGSLYQYFPNRLAILAALADRELRQIDAATVAAIEASAALPWQQAVDLVVDSAAQAHHDHQQCAGLFRSLQPTLEFGDLARASNRRLAAALAKHPGLVGAGLPVEETERVARVAIEAGDCVQSLVLGADSPREREALAEEMKKLLKAYLALYIEQPAAGIADGRPNSPEPIEDRT